MDHIEWIVKILKVLIKNTSRRQEDYIMAVALYKAKYQLDEVKVPRPSRISLKDPLREKLGG